MDTKSKKFRFHIGFKILAWALCAVSACGAVFLARGMRHTGIDNAAPAYADSAESNGELNAYIAYIRQTYFRPGEDAVRREADEYVNALHAEQTEELARVAALGSVDEVYQYDETFDGGADSVSEYAARRAEEIRERYTRLIADAEQHIRESHEESAALARKRIEGQTGLIYAVVDAGVLSETNVRQENPLGHIWQSGAKMAAAFSRDGEMLYQSGGTGAEDVPPGFEADIKVYAAVSPDVYDARAAEYDRRYGLFRQYFEWLVCALAAFAAGFVWLMYTAGRQTDSDEIKTGAADAVYLDVGFLLMMAGAAFLLVVAVAYTGSDWFYVPRLGAVGIFAVGAAVAGTVSMMLLWGMSLARRIRQGSAARYTLCYRIYGGIRGLHTRAGANTQAVAAFVLYMLAGMVSAVVTAAGFAAWAPGLAVTGLALVLIYIISSLRYVLKKARAIREIEDGVGEIKNGNMEYAIPVEGDTPMGHIAQGVNNIAEGLAGAVRKEVKAERMKTELITNISHDLKTPLTSILTYVDLLRKEPGLSDNALRYIEVLDAKSNRLKILTDDLFEAAKASSGDMAVNMTHIELTQFMEQAMGEMSDRMDAAPLYFMIDMPEERLYVEADGKLLFRVIGNMIDNVIKYGMEGSRVYIDMERNEESVCMVMKNISKEALNITEEELMERFVRGDSSRNTEGSGLGLAIARNFMQLMGGRFLIEIDGDLFKAKVCLKRSYPGCQVSAD